MRGVLTSASAAQRLAHAVHQRAVLIRDRRNNPRNQIVLQLENRFRTETAFIVLSPQMSARSRINELYRDTQLRSRLPQAAFHHVARAQFCARGTHASRCGARDHPEVREARQACDDLLGQRLGQSGDLGGCSAGLEGHHRDPESLVRPDPSRVRARIRSSCFGLEGSDPRRVGRSLGRGNRKACLAQPFEDGVHEAAREVPGPDVRARVCRKLGIERQQIPDCRLGFGAPPEVPAGRRHHEVWPEESGYVDTVRALEGLLVLLLVEVIPEGSEGHPPRVVGIQLHRAAHDRGASLELARVHDLQSQDADRVGVERIESHRALGRRAKRCEVLAEKVRLRQ